MATFLRLITTVAIGLWIIGGGYGSSDSASSLNAKCRDLLTCTIQKECAQISFLEKAFEGENITSKLYEALDKGIDYGCIFTTGCQEECNRCPLCQTSKDQLVDVLSGNKRELGGECALLVNCATDCIQLANGDITKINYCLRQKCAFHCFDGSCPKCSAFITRIFNQVCVSGNFRKIVNGWEGHCYQMFRGIVQAKFQDEFTRTGKTAAIGLRSDRGQKHRV